MAHELAEPYPYVPTDDAATDAALLPAEHKLPALLVVDRDHQPYAVVPGSQPVGRLVPEYALQDPPPRPGSPTGTSTKYLTGSSGSRPRWRSPRSSEAENGGRPPRRRFRPPTAGPDAGVLHIAALMARTHTPLVTVVERDGDQRWPVGAVTATRLMERLIGGT